MIIFGRLICLKMETINRSRSIRTVSSFCISFYHFDLIRLVEKDLYIQSYSFPLKCAAGLR